MDHIVFNESNKANRCLKSIKKFVLHELFQTTFLLDDTSRG